MSKFALLEPYITTSSKNKNEVITMVYVAMTTNSKGFALWLLIIYKYNKIPMDLDAQLKCVLFRVLNSYVLYFLIR